MVKEPAFCTPPEVKPENLEGSALPTTLLVFVFPPPLLSLHPIFSLQALFPSLSCCASVPSSFSLTPSLLLPLLSLLPPSAPHILLSPLPSCLLPAFLWVPLLCFLSLLPSPSFSFPLFISPPLSYSPEKKQSTRSPHPQKPSKDKTPCPWSLNLNLLCRDHSAPRMPGGLQRAGAGRRHGAGGQQFAAACPPSHPPSLLASHHAKKSKLLW